MEKSPEEMRKAMIEQLAGKTGKSFPEWQKLIRAGKFSKHGEIMKFLKGQHDSQDVQNKDDIKIEAECKLKYGSLMEVIDACRNGGFQKVGFAPPPDYQQNQ